jgi:5-methylcytosine-specific restriction endonuclease McrA
MFRTKVCAKCKVEKDETEFYRCARGSDGLHSFCKHCWIEINRQRRERRKSLYEGVDVYDGADRTCTKCGVVFPKEERYWVKNSNNCGGLDPHCRTCNRRRNLGYKDTGDLTIDLVGRIVRKWNKSRANRRNKKEDATRWTNHSKACFFDMLIKQRARCAVSGIHLTPENVSIDHIVPLIKGGTHELSNLRLVAWDVNQAMSSRSDEDFIELCRQVVNYQLDLLIYGNEKAPVSESHTGAHSVPALGQSLTLDELP